MSRSTARRIVAFGFQTEPRPQLVDKYPIPSPPSTYKTDEAKAKYVREATDKLNEKVGGMIYLSRLAKIAIRELEATKIKTFERNDANGKSCAELFAAYLEETYGDAFKNDDILFVGPDPRLLFKMLGADCLMPDVGYALPRWLWVASDQFQYDVESLLLPDRVSPPADASWVLSAISACYPEGDPLKTKFDKALEGWRGFGVDCLADMKIAYHFASRIRTTWE